MSGHSKWSKVKHQKEGTDALKGQAFTKASRAISVAVREGGGISDPAANFKLRLAIEQARAVNMPKDTIERAIEKGKGATAGALQSLVYEGYGPGGVAMLVEAATDNPMRTGSEVRHLFEYYGGSLAGPGAVSYQFKRAIVLKIPKNGKTFDEVFPVAVESGADDAVEGESSYDVYIYGASDNTVREKLQKAGLPVSETQLIMKPVTTVSLSEEGSEKLVDLVGSLNDLEDVATVYTNYEATNS